MKCLFPPIFSSQTREDVNSLKNVHNNKAVKPLNRVGGSPLQRPYNTYYKFVVFRHPFTRMVRHQNGFT